MRLALVSLIGVTLIAAGVITSTAFTAANVGARVVTVSIVGDGEGYVSVQPTSGNAHSCFVSTDAGSGKLAISLASAALCAAGGTGTGVNAGGGSKYARYALHDILTIKNQGQKTVEVWVNATSTSGTVDVNKATSAASMNEAGYYSSSATSITLTSTSSFYVGVRVNASLSQGSAVAGTITIAART